MIGVGADRGRFRLLLASASVSALLIGGGMPAALAAGCVNGAGSGTGYDNALAATVPGICVNNTSFTGNITNEGTISASGIAFTNGTMSGYIASSGVIVGGILIDSASKIVTTKLGIGVAGPSFSGGISNAGAISAGNAAIVVGEILNGTGSYIGNVTSFSGGVSNRGTISSTTNVGIAVSHVSSFFGGISNSGVISAGGSGITVVGSSTFSGGVTNSGTISTNGYGIFVDGVNNFSGGIGNSGTISAGYVGIEVALGSTFSGGISNGGTISTGNTGISVAISTFSGGISNSGTISAYHSFPGIDVNNVSAFSGGISNSGTISSNGGFVLFVDNVSSFSGGISNSGTISGRSTSGYASVFFGNVSTFAGGITNTGSIVGAVGINVYNVNAVSIFDSGTITGIGGTAIEILSGAGTNTLTLGPGFAITGNVLGAGSDIFQLGGTGSGSFNLSTIGATQQYQGFTTFNVIGGTWTVTNTFGQSQPWNVNGGTLAGTGTLTAVNVNAGGTLQPGTPGSAGGTLHIAGNAIFASGSNYRETISGSSASETIITGTATLGDANVTIATGSTVTTGTPYLILTDTAGGLGVGGNVFNPTVSYNGYTGALTYTPDDVYLTFSGTGAGCYTGPFPHTNSGSIPCIQASNTSFSGNIVNAASGVISPGSSSGVGILVSSATIAGNISNAGTISAPTGISLVGATINGSILDSGVIQATSHGILIDSASKIISTATAIAVTGPTFTGGISNAGTISAGVDALSVSGVSTFSGGIINSGTISAGGVGIQVQLVSTFAGNISNSGTITAATGIRIYNGVTFAAGAIVNSGNITGTGGTAIDASGASSAVTIDQNAGNITGNIKLSANADVMTIAGGTVAGNIVGQNAGTLNFSLGSGTTYTDSNTFTRINQVNINSGTVLLNNTDSANNINVFSGATLGGAGTLNSLAVTIQSGGTFAPGSGIAGTSMTVAGNLAFQSGAIYLVQVNPASSSFANVTGTATLNGASVDALFASGSYISKQYTILTATGGLGGSSFSGITNTNLPSGFTNSLSYDTTHAYLNLTLGFTPPPSFSSFNVNQQNVANALINFFNTSGGIPMVFGTLTPAGLTQASGEIATGTQQTTFDAMNLFMGLLTDPFVAGRGNPVSASGGASGYADAANAYTSDGKPRSRLERDAYAAVYTKAPPADPFVQRWSVWGAAYGGSQTTDGNAALGSNTATSSIYGTAVGADYRISPNTLAGFALAGGGTSFSIANGLGSGRSDLFQAGAFVRHTVGPAYITAALAYGWQDITTNRTVTIAGADLLHAEFNANAISGRLEGGYRYVVPWMGITPYAAAQFTTFDLPSYAESVLSGASTFALAYNAASVTDARSELGLRTDKSWAMTDSIFTLRSRFAWAHDYDPNRTIAATFQTLPGASFVVNGAAQARDSALTTASAELKWRNGWSVTATFEGAFSNVTTSYAGKGVVRYTW